MTSNHLQDAQHRLRALDPTTSFIVQAPAGSGKTELLTQRFLVLLGSVKQPEEILAITFTKKSAAEMRARIINALKNAAQHPEPESAHAKHTWQLAKLALHRDQALNWHLLDNPSRLQIQTIDSFNASLTRQLPLLSNFGAPLEIADDPTSLYRAAVQEFLTHLETEYVWALAIEKLLLHMDNDLNKVENLLIQMLAKRDQWLPYITLNADDAQLRSTLEKNLMNIVTDTLTLLKKVFPAYKAQELVLLAQYAGQNLLRDDPTSCITACAHLNNMPSDNIEDLPLWQGIAKLLLTDGNTWRKDIKKTQGFPAPSDTKNFEQKKLLTQFKERIKILIEDLSTEEKLLSGFIELRSLPESHYQDSQWETLDALHDVLRIVVAQLKVVFQTYGKVDYIENAQAAHQALGEEDNPTDLTLALDYRIQHILIDEFQDTSNSQNRLLEKLLAGWYTDDGRTLFVVGDPMQSIYRFREAEVGLFIRARQRGINHLYLEPLTLSVNFRSVPGVVNWVNEHFAKIFPSTEDIASGAVSYSASTAAQNIQTEKSPVQLHPFINADEFMQAEAIVNLIKQIKQQNLNEKITILVRSRTHLNAIIPALNQANIIFRALDIDPLATRPVIQDLLALTRALLHPADRIAWLSILRAPWCGLSLEDLLCIAGDKNKQIIWEQLQSIQLQGESQQRLQRIIPVLKNALTERRRYTLRQWIENTWLLLGGPACVDQQPDLNDAHAFFKLLEKLDDAADLPDLKNLHEAISKLYAAPSHNSDNTLQIMTIHNAKGLEFDTVIIPHLERKASQDNKQLLQWMEYPRSDESSALILAPIRAVGEKESAIYDYIALQQKIKMQHEHGRLLYVAATRAKKELHLFFNLESKQDLPLEISKPAPDSLLEKLWPAIHDQIIYSLPKAPLSLSTNKPNLHKKSLKRLLNTWQNPLSNDFFTEKNHYHQKSSGFLLPDNTQKLIGTMIHSILQQISLYSFDWWQNKGNNKENYIKTHLLQLGMQKQVLETAITTVSRAISNTLHDQRGRWILAAHTEAKSELALTLRLNEEIKNLVIDRTFVDEKGIRWIIDYKSADYSGDNLENFLLTEQKLYEKKLWEYHLAMREIDTRPIRIGLYFPLICGWKEWQFD